MVTKIYTIGHSNHSVEAFIGLTHQADIDVVADVRTAPYSQYSPQFNQAALRRSLADAGLGYVFLGRELGGRPDGDEFYDDAGHVHYDKVRETELFRLGVDRLLGGAADHRVAIMCSEGHPGECHRHLLVARVLVAQGVEVDHVLPDGRTVGAAELLNQQRPPPTLFGEEEMQWTSIRSVSPNTPPSSSSKS